MPGFEVDHTALLRARAALVDGTADLAASAHRGPEVACRAAADALPGARTAAALHDLAASVVRALDASTAAVAGFADLLSESAARYAAVDRDVVR